jgi:hypothetical protein
VSSYARAPIVPPWRGLFLHRARRLQRNFRLRSDPRIRAVKEVFISMNAENHPVIEPAQEPSAGKGAEDSRDPNPASKSLDAPGVLDSRGRLKLPADIRRFLRGDDDPA